MPTRDISAEKVTLTVKNPEMKSKSKPSSLIALGRRRRQRSAGWRARVCAGWSEDPGTLLAGTVAVSASRGELGREEITTFWETMLSGIFYCFDLEGEGEDLQERHFKS